MREPLDRTKPSASSTRPGRVEGEDLESSAYRLLSEEVGLEAHARLNALRAELESGIVALEREQRVAASS